MHKRSKEIYPGQRSKEKYELFKIFRHPDIEAVYKEKFFSLFDDCCFKCGVIEKLDIDHHIPMALGGHLVPGNLVALCKECNNKKRDALPSTFYTPQELEKLTPLLEAQKEIFNFKWDWDFYNKNRKEYFAYLGVSPNKIERIFNDPDYDYYLSPIEEGVIFSISLEDIKNANEK